MIAEGTREIESGTADNVVGPLRTEVTNLKRDLAIIRDALLTAHYALRDGQPTTHVEYGEESKIRDAVELGKEIRGMNPPSPGAQA